MRTKTAPYCLVAVLAILYSGLFTYIAFLSDMIASLRGLSTWEIWIKRCGTLYKADHSPLLMEVSQLGLPSTAEPTLILSLQFTPEPEGITTV